jgi:hypothetical protein
MQKKLLSSLEEVLTKGLFADDQVFDFMEAVFGNMDPEEYAATLSRVLEDEDEPEHEQLKELLLFPDEAFRRAVEPALEEAELSKDELPAVAEALAAEGIIVPVAVPGTQTLLRIKLDEDLAELLLSRLHAEVRLDERLRESADEHLSADDSTAAKVRLRSSHLEMNEGLVLFLRRVLVKMGEGAVGLDDLSILLVLLAEDSQGTDVFELLKQKKIAAVEELRLKKEQEERLAKSNTETMLMAGERILAFDEEALRDRVAMIDRVCRAVFGVLVEAGADIPARDLGSFDPEEDVENLTRLFNPEA